MLPTDAWFEQVAGSSTPYSPRCKNGTHKLRWSAIQGPDKESLSDLWWFNASSNSPHPFSSYQVVPDIESSRACQHEQMKLTYWQTGSGTVKSAFVPLHTASRTIEPHLERELSKQQSLTHFAGHEDKSCIGEFRWCWHIVQCSGYER